MAVSRIEYAALLNVCHWKCMVFVSTCQNQSRVFCRLAASDFQAIGPCDISLPAARSLVPIEMQKRYNTCIPSA